MNTRSISDRDSVVFLAVERSRILGSYPKTQASKLVRGLPDLVCCDTAVREDNSTE